MAATATTAKDLTPLFDRPALHAHPRDHAGPLYFDADNIRSDIREDRPGARATRAQGPGQRDCAPLPNAVVEIWHCDAAGSYSGGDRPAVRRTAQPT